MIPDPDIQEILFKCPIDVNELQDLVGREDFFQAGDFHEIHWLNTPGPIYTTCTDNCGTGQIEAINNVGGDEDYCEIICKQPFTREELQLTVSAAKIDPFGAYYFDGSQHWNKDNILEWWGKSKERVNYILDRYYYELQLPEKPHVSSYKIGKEIFTGQLFGPPRPVPENYKYWLEFYQHDMKRYLEWYASKLHGQSIMLPPFSFDWSKKEDLDKEFISKQPPA